MSGIFSALSLLLEEIGGAPYEAFHAFAKSRVVEVLSMVGWDAKDTDGHTDKLLRATLINLLDTFGHNDPQVLSEVN
jgi:hypothetical protein